MKNKLTIGVSILSLFLLVGCTPKKGSSSKQEESTPETSQAENDDARLFKKAGDQMLQLAKAKMPQNPSPVHKGWQPASADSLAFELRQPGIYFYLTGTVMDRANYDMTAKPIYFNGEFNVKMGSQTSYMALEVDMKSSLDKVNGKMFFSGYQKSKQGQSKEETTEHYSPLFYEIGYDFANEEVKDFKYYQKSDSETIIYFEYDKASDEGRYYYVFEDDTSDDGNRLRSEYNARKSAFDAELEQKTVATGELNKQCCLSFCDTQAYVNTVFGNEGMELIYIGE
ncbi:MAG: hypothetical protein IJK27_00505 [Bacilli bacterium]|nr:hypothetical protein [Bacilli bacterium]